MLSVSANLYIACLLTNIDLKLVTSNCCVAVDIIYIIYLRSTHLDYLISLKMHYA